MTLKKWFIYKVFGDQSAMREVFAALAKHSMAAIAAPTIEGNYIIPNGLVQDLHTSSVVIPQKQLTQTSSVNGQQKRSKLEQS